MFQVSPAAQHSAHLQRNLRNASSLFLALLGIDTDTVFRSLQRIKGAIDRTIAEEQARQKTLSDSSTTHSRSASASAPARRRPSSKNSPLQMPEAASNPDPAVFEAAFVIDDSDEASRSATPGPQVPEKDTHSPGLKNGADGKRQALAGSPVGKAETKSITKDGGDKPYAPSLASSATVVDPTPEIRVRLRKLEKLEATYPGEN